MKPLKNINSGIFPELGFLCPLQAPTELTSELEALELVVRQLPSLLRRGSLRSVVHSLPRLKETIHTIPTKYLPRYSILMSSIAHALIYEERQLHQTFSGTTPSSSLPNNVLSGWQALSYRLGRSLPGRTVEDDMLNNCKIIDAVSAELSIPYFDIPEEHMSVGLQVLMEYRFAIARGAMMDAGWHMVGSNSENTIAADLHLISQGLMDCFHAFTSIPTASCDGPNHFDPIIWGKTYPDMGRPVLPGELTNSGGNSPMFHALDAFIGVMDTSKCNELYHQQLKRRLLLPPSVQHCLGVIEEAHHNVKNHITHHPNSIVSNLFIATLQYYACLLERHRMRAVGCTPIVLASGRLQTAGGVARSSIDSPGDMLDTQIRKAMVSRFGLQTPALLAKVASRLPAGSNATCLTLILPCSPPIHPGDTIQIWPEAVSIHVAEQEKSWATSNLPRYYSIAYTEVMADQSTRLYLTIAHSAGHSGELLRSLPIGASIKVILRPRPEFWCPKESSQPLLLIAQGAGLGPFIGFLRERYKESAPSGLGGKIILIVAARGLESVPYLQNLLYLVQKLPLEIHLAVSVRHYQVTEDGRVHIYDSGTNILEILNKISPSIKNILLERKGHIFVSGSGAFGATVRGKLEELGVLAHGHGHYHDACRGGKPRTAIPEREIPLQELSRHNTVSDLWVAIGGVVYDLTAFSKQHPGGIKTIVDVAGTVADKRFFQIHPDDTNQGLLSRVRTHAVGKLQPLPCITERMRILNMVVKQQNALTNNTTFASGRIVPFYVFCDSLLVCWGLFDGIARLVRDVGLNPVLLASLQDASHRLKSACWEQLAECPKSILEETETAIRNAYAMYWAECQTIFESLKDICCAEHTADMELADMISRHLVTSLGSMGSRLEVSCLGGLW